MGGGAVVVYVVRGSGNFFVYSSLGMLYYYNNCTFFFTTFMDLPRGQDPEDGLGVDTGVTIVVSGAMDRMSYIRFLGVGPLVGWGTAITRATREVRWEAYTGYLARFFVLVFHGVCLLVATGSGGGCRLFG